MILKAALLWFPLLGFLVGMIWRLRKLLNAPPHLRWELYPIPHESAARAEYGGSRMEEYGWWARPAQRRRWAVWRYILIEVISLKSLRRNLHGIHLPSLFLHWGVYLWIIATISIWGIAIFSEITRSLAGATRVLGLLGGALGLVGVVWLLVKRALDSELRSFSKPVRFVGLGFLGLLFASRILLLYSDSGGIGREVALIRFLLGKTPFPGADLMAITDMVVTGLFLLTIPWTQFSHSFAKFFTFHSVRWDDAEVIEGGKRAAEIATELERTPAWSASHLTRGGKGNWKKIASEGGNAS